MTSKQPLFFDVYVYVSEFCCELQNMQNTNRASLSLIGKQFLAVLHMQRCVKSLSVFRLVMTAVLLNH